MTQLNWNYGIPAWVNAFDYKSLISLQLAEISQMDFFNMMHNNLPARIEFESTHDADLIQKLQQIRRDDSPIHADWYFFDDSIIMIEYQFWANRVVCVKFAACFHEMREVSGRSLGKPDMNCYHYYKCIKCSYTEEHDSSD